MGLMCTHYANRSPVEAAFEWYCTRLEETKDTQEEQEIKTLKIRGKGVVSQPIKEKMGIRTMDMQRERESLSSHQLYCFLCSPHRCS